MLSGFFAWTVRERLRVDNPVARTSVAHQLLPAQGMQPFTEVELDAVRSDIAPYNEHLADVVWLLAWTGLRWSEARELRVADFIEVPMPRLVVRRSAPGTVEAKPTKSGRTRHVPLSDDLLPLVRSMAKDTSGAHDPGSTTLNFPEPPTGFEPATSSLQVTTWPCFARHFSCIHGSGVSDSAVGVRRGHLANAISSSIGSVDSG